MAGRRKMDVAFDGRLSVIRDTTVHEWNTCRTALVERSKRCCRLLHFLAGEPAILLGLSAWQSCGRRCGSLRAIKPCLLQHANRDYSPAPQLSAQWWLEQPRHVGFQEYQND